MPELASYLEGLPEPHILFYMRYRIVSVNAAYRWQFSPARRVVGRTCHEVSHHFSVSCDRDGSQFQRLFEDGDRFAIGNRQARALHTPGHTPACMTYVIEDGSDTAAWVGDTLLMPNYGTALPLDVL